MNRSIHVWTSIVVVAASLGASIASPGGIAGVAQAAAQSAPAREAYADLPGVRLWYKDTGGSGIPVVFLHANTGSSRNWEYQISAFTAAGYRFIAYDRRGWGQSVTAAGAQ